MLICLCTDAYLFHQKKKQSQNRQKQCLQQTVRLLEEFSFVLFDLGLRVHLFLLNVVQAFAQHLCGEITVENVIFIEAWRSRENALKMGKSRA